MDTCNTYFQCCSLSLFTDHRLNFFLCLFYHLLNSCRMDTTVNDQSFKSNPCYFPADRIKS